MNNLVCAAILNGLSLHAGSGYIDDHGLTHKYEQFNPGLGIECNNVQAGVYRNSQHHDGAYAFKFFDIPQGNVGNRLQLEIGAGVVAGYEISPVLPVIFPSASLRFFDNFGARVFLIPPCAITPLTVGLQFRIGQLEGNK